MVVSVFSIHSNMQVYNDEQSN